MRIDRGDYHWMPDDGPLPADYLPEQLRPELHDALAEVPELPAVVDHIAKPSFEWDADGDWRAGMTTLAERPCTYCKLYGVSVAAVG